MKPDKRSVLKREPEEGRHRVTVKMKCERIGRPFLTYPPRDKTNSGQKTLISQGLKVFKTEGFTRTRRRSRSGHGQGRGHQLEVKKEKESKSPEDGHGIIL